MTIKFTAGTATLTEELDASKARMAIIKHHKQAVLDHIDLLKKTEDGISLAGCFDLTSRLSGLSVRQIARYWYGK